MNNSNLSTYLSALSLLFSVTLYSQGEFRFRDNNSTQIESRILTGSHGFYGSYEYRELFFSNDTIIDDNQYQVVKGRLYSYVNTETGEMEYIVDDYEDFAAIRKDSLDKVYIRFTAPIPNVFVDNHYSGFVEGEDNLLYDFAVNEGDTVGWKTGFAKVVSTVDSIDLGNGEIRKRIVFYRENGWEYHTDIWIEGMGSTKGLLGSYRVTDSPQGPHVNLCCSFSDLDELEYDFWQAEAESSLSNNFNCIEDISTMTEGVIMPFEDPIKVFPNPLYADELSITSSYLASEVSSLRVLNIHGAEVLRIPVEADSELNFTRTIDMSNVASGFYVLVLDLKSRNKLTSRLIRL